MILVKHLYKAQYHLLRTDIQKFSLNIQSPLDANIANVGNLMKSDTLHTKL